MHAGDVDGIDGIGGIGAARLHALPSFVDIGIANLRRGVTLGYTAPKVVVRAVVTQLDGLLATPPAASPFASPAQRDSEPAFRAEYLRLIEQELVPAMRRYRGYLAGEYLAAAREALGVSANPHGVECYRAAVRSFATVDRMPEDVYQASSYMIGKLEILRLREQARKAFGPRFDRRHITHAGGIDPALDRLRPVSCRRPGPACGACC